MKSVTQPQSLSARLFNRPRKARRILHLTSAAVVALAMLVPSVSTHAASEATIVVNTVADQNGSGVECSLREAIIASNTDAAFGGCTAGASVDTITFNLPANSTITITGAEPNIPVASLGQKFTIDGSTAVNLTVNRTTAGRLLKVETVTADVTLIGFTMSGGNVLSTTLPPFSDGNGSGGAVLSLGPAVILNNMTFRNNYAANFGGAVYAGSVITATNSRFENNSAGYSGGAVFAGLNDSGTSSVANSTFLTNTARFEGGAFFIKGSTDLGEPRRLRVSDSTFLNNSVTAPLGGQAARGGAILANSPVEISKSRFENNRSTVFCGGVYLYNAESITQLTNVPLTVTETVFINNDGYLGGALCGDGPVTVTSSNFERNDATGDDGGAVRGRSDVTINNSTFITNSAASDGGAVAAVPNAFPPSNVPLKLTINRSTFTNNSVPGGSGGAIFGQGLTAASTLVNNLFTTNSSASGGVLATGVTSTLSVQFNTFANNTSNVDKGIVDALGGTVTINNNIFANNTGIAVNKQFSGVATENYNLFFNNSGGDRGTGVATGVNSATGNPNFISATDFHLSATSTAAIDKASAATVNIDFDGDLRPLAAARDIGYDEFNPNAVIAGLNLLTSSPTRLGNVTAMTTTVTSGSGITYVFNYGDGSPVTASSAISTTSHIYAAAGTYTAIVTATNSFGSASKTATVTITNLAPVANAGPDSSVTPGASVTLNGSASADPDNHTPLSYLWTQTAGPAVTLSDATIASPSFTAPATPGTLTFSLIVTDSAGAASAADTVSIAVNASAISGLTGSATSPTSLGQATLFSASVTSGATPITYDWDFGDGTLGSGDSLTHTYAAAGLYTVTLTASNSAGSVVAAPIYVNVVSADFKAFLPLMRRATP